MMRKTYIRAASCLSAQNTLTADGFLTDIKEYAGTRMNAVEPDYKTYIDPKLIRRMSHVIKMGVAAAQDCLNQADGSNPDAIITGTALGCLEDTVTFLSRIVEMNEEMLPPTAFIQSTHNTVAAQVALMLGNHGYNNTFVHKGVSFENALIDALMLINEGEVNSVLAGGLDELTDASFAILTRLGLYKRQSVSNLKLYNEESKGSIAGEGAAFFLLSNDASPENMAELKGVKTFYNVADSIAIENQIKKFLTNQTLSMDNIDLIITGKNGDTKNDAVYKALDILNDQPQVVYKHLSGEYPTSTGFALWLAANCIKRQEVPAVISKNQVPPKNILIYNHYQNFYHSLFLVSAC